MRIAIANSKNSKSWKNIDLTWDDFTARCCNCRRTGETAKEYDEMTKAQRDLRKDVGCFVGGEIEGGRRTNQTIKYRTLVCLDADHARADFKQHVQGAFHNVRLAAYTTHSHRPDAPRWRLIFALNRNVSVEEYEPLARLLANRIGLEFFDPTCYEFSRLMYWPSASDDAAFDTLVQEGDPVDVDHWLNFYEENWGSDWHDTANWPLAPGEKKRRVRRVGKMADPTQKKGIVGHFCRAYTISEAIEHFIPEAYEEITPDRWTFVNGSTTGGMVVYDNDLFAYSHHATDPISGREVNAWDLVRLHKFGHLDRDAKPNATVTSLPSYKAMDALAREDEKVRKEISRDLLDSFDGVDDEDMSWVSRLERNKRDKIVCSLANILLIWNHDPKLKDVVAHDVYANEYPVLRDLPWRKKEEQRLWCDTDDLQFRVYLNLTYGMGIKRETVYDATINFIRSRKIHPVKNFIQRAEWDGVKRIDTLFHDYLGAEDNEYTRAATRLFFRGAIARVMRPACKFDYCFVLSGRQGIGKSTLLQKLGGDWYTDSVTSLVGKDAVVQIQGKWIVEFSEAQATTRAENDNLKAFITRTSDKIRLPYGRQVEDLPRKCVFVTTTNENIMLKDRTGGRRFLMIPCGAKSYMPLPDDIIAQIWAEAFVDYKEHEYDLVMPKELMAQATALQEASTEGSEKAGLVEGFLDADLPEMWADLAPDEKRSFFNGTSLLQTEGQKSIKRNEISAIEVFCECFNRDKGSMTNKDAREINAIMQHTLGWKRSANKKRIKGYGIQRVFIRP